MAEMDGTSADVGALGYIKFLEGDDAGFVEMLKEHKDALLFYIFTFTGNLHLAEELCEDTFFKLLIEKPQYKGKASFKTWLFTIGRNVAMDHLRKASQAEIPLREDLLAGEGDPEEIYLKKEREIILAKAMRNLKEEYRQALWLVYFEGLSHKDVGSVMKKTTRAVDTLIWRARAALKNQLEKEGFDYENL